MLSKYHWMGQLANIRLQPYEDQKAFVMLEQPNQDYIMGMVEKIGDQYIARAKGQQFVAATQDQAVMMLMDFMHDEAMAAKMALQMIVVDNLLGD